MASHYLWQPLISLSLIPAFSTLRRENCEFKASKSEVRVTPDWGGGRKGKREGEEAQCLVGALSSPISRDSGYVEAVSQLNTISFILKGDS